MRDRAIGAVCLAALWGMLFIRPAMGDPLQDKIQEALRSSGVPVATTGICVLRVPSGDPLFSHNADQPLIPASTMKLVTTAGVLNALGADYTLQTQLGVKGQDLVIIGGGDPSLGNEFIAKSENENQFAFLDRWVEAVKATKQASFRNIILMDGLFDRKMSHPDWPANQLGLFYTAKVSAINLNDNCVDITVKGQKAGEPVLVETVLPDVSDHIKNNHCVSGSAKAGIPVVIDPQTGDIELKGTCPSGKSATATVAVEEPAKLLANVLKSKLQKAGINVTGEIEFDHAALTLDQIAKMPNIKVLTAEKHPLSLVIAKTNKYSQNLFAECLCKVSGAAFAAKGLAGKAPTEPIGTWDNGKAAAEKFLTDMKIPKGQFIIDDGSGLSKNNRVSAFTLAYLLLWMSNQPSGKVFEDSLARMGIEGTLTKRMKGTVCQGKVHAKSGYVNGVSCLAGYVETQQGGKVVFAVMVNGFKGTAHPAKHLEDEVCEILLRNTPPAGKAEVTVAAKPAAGHGKKTK